MRHQRNPDVVFDFVREDKGLTEDKPEFIYKVIETLLPTAKYEPSTKQIGFLELWAKPKIAREGWITVVHKF